MDRDEFFAGASGVPPSVFGKFGLAFQLLGSNLVLFSLIILTVWLPVNLLIETMEVYAPADQKGLASIRLNFLMQGVFGLIPIGALIFALSKRVQGQAVTYPEAMSVGLRRWGSLFVASFVAGLLILLGFVALIVPGIIFQVRYSLLDSAVVLEGSTEPRRRSTRLTEGRRWSIFWAYVLFFVIYFPTATAIAAAVSLFDVLDTYWVSVAIDCVNDVLASIATIVMFLFYWEARLREPSSSKPAVDDGHPYRPTGEYL